MTPDSDDEKRFRVVAVHAPESPNLPPALDGCAFYEVEPQFSVYDVIGGDAENAEAIGALMFKYGTMTDGGTFLLPDGWLPDDAQLGDVVTARECYVAAARTMAGALDGVIESMSEAVSAVADGVAEALGDSLTADDDEVPDR